MTQAELRTARIVCTPKELDVCILIAAGRTQREIAMALNITQRTVRNRRDNAHRKIAHHQHREQAA